MKREINIDQYPQLKVQEEYISRLTRLVGLLNDRLVGLLNDRLEYLKGARKATQTIGNASEETERLISIEKTTLEIQSLERQIDEKKLKHQGLLDILHETLDRMEHDYDLILNQGRKIPDVKKLIDETIVDTDEAKLDLYLKVKEGISNWNATRGDGIKRAVKPVGKDKKVRVGKLGRK